MRKKNLLGIFALTILASSFSSCTKTVYVPDSTYYDNMNTTGRVANQGSESFYSSRNKSGNNNYRTAPSLIDRVNNNNDYQRPDRPQRPMGDRVAMGPNQRPATNMNPSVYNTYPEVAIVEEVQYDDIYNRPASQPVQVQTSARPQAQVQPQLSAPTPPPAQQQYNYSNAPKVKANKNIPSTPNNTQQYNYSNAPATTKRANTPVATNNQQQYYYDTPQANIATENEAQAPKVNTYNAPVQPQQDVPFSQYFDKNVTIFFKNGAKLDGVISRHPNSTSKLIIKLPDGSTYEGATKDIEKVDYKY